MTRVALPHDAKAGPTTTSQRRFLYGRGHRRSRPMLAAFHPAVDVEDDSVAVVEGPVSYL